MRKPTPQIRCSLWGRGVGGGVGDGGSRTLHEFSRLESDDVRTWPSYVTVRPPTAVAASAVSAARTSPAKP